MNGHYGHILCLCDQLDIVDHWSHHKMEMFNSETHFFLYLTTPAISTTCCFLVGMARGYVLSLDGRDMSLFVV